MYKYIGQGFIPGVPARDLTNAEAREHGIERLLKSGLYIKESEKPKPTDNKMGQGSTENK